MQDDKTKLTDVEGYIMFTGFVIFLVGLVICAHALPWELIVGPVLTGLGWWFLYAANYSYVKRNKSNDN